MQKIRFPKPLLGDALFLCSGRERKFHNRSLRESQLEHPLRLNANT
jgi:hypothetical protein